MEPVVQPVRRPYAALPLGWAALLLYLTLAPADKLPPQPKWELLSFDTFAHAAFFAVQAILAWFSLRRQTRWPWLKRHAGAAVLLGCAAFGAIIEVLQMALPFNRHGEWSDLISDCLGTVLALGLCHLAVPMMQRRSWLLGVLVILIALPAGAQDMSRARKTIETLASRRMHGRGYVEQGERKAAAYLRERLRGLGLHPLAMDYMQPFALDVNTFPAGLSLSLIETLPEQPLRPGQDFIAAPESGGCAISPEYVAQPLDTLVFSDSTVRKGYLLLGTLNRSRAFTPHIISRAAPVAIVLRARDAARLPTLPPELQRFFAEVPLLVLQPKLTASLAASQSGHAALYVLDGCWPSTATGQLLSQRIRIEVEPDLQRNYPTQNLCAILPGRTQPDSFLIISAHYDHLGMMGRKTYFPGANDNASGVALLLELAAHYAKPENRPACSVVFLLFGAEEAGLVGSRYFVAHPLVPLPRIKFLINLDLLGTGEEGATVVNGKVFPAAFEKLTKLNEAHHYLPSLGARGKAANSDHFPFSEAGVPAFFIYTRGGSKAYHDVNDRPEALSLAGFAGAFGLVRDFLDELGAMSGAKK